MSKGRYDLALECAKRAVNSAPSEFTTWERLAQVYLKLEQYELALLTLNSCPMFTYQDRDIPKMPLPSRMHLPILPESVLDEMSDDLHDPKHDMVDPTLLKLPAGSLKGTFKRAYRILTEITNQIGWDQLLKCRSGVFVMEEEYRHEKSASVVGMKGSVGDEEVEEDSEEDIPAVNGDVTPEEAAKTNGESEQTEDIGLKDSTEAETVESTSDIEKPGQTILPEEAKVDEDATPIDSAKTSTAQKYTHFQNKRLCERWLDNLFMVLYEVC